MISTEASIFPSHNDESLVRASYSWMTGKWLGVDTSWRPIANVKLIVLFWPLALVMHPRHYRLRFAIDVLKNVFAPQILLAIVFSLCRSKLGTFFRVTAYTLSVPAAGALRTWYKDRRDRAALGESPCIPRNTHQVSRRSPLRASMFRRSRSGRYSDSESSRQVARKSGHCSGFHSVSP